MARPLKRNADYFPHDADASDGKILTILFNNFGHEGISFWWQLSERITRAENHVINLGNPVDMEFICGKMHFESQRLEEILDKCAFIGAIDAELWEHRIIWCQDLVDRLKDAWSQRQDGLPMKPDVSSPDNPVSSPDNPQSKVKESKLKETKGNKSSSSNVDIEEREPPPWLKLLLDTFSEFQPEVNWITMIERAWTDINLEEMTQEFVSFWGKKTNDQSVIQAQFVNSLHHARENGKFKSKEKDYFKGKYGHLVQR